MNVFNNGRMTIGGLGSAACGLFALVLLGGCGNEPFSMVKCSGRIAYEDGTPLPTGVTLMFIPQTPPRDTKTNPRPGVARTKPDGAFDVITSHNYADGLTAGKHKVVIYGQSRDQVPEGVPPEYNSASRTPLEVDTALAPFDLKVRKPK